MEQNDKEFKYKKFKEQLETGIPAQSVSKHSKYLEDGKIMIRGKDGRYLAEEFEGMTKILGIAPRNNAKQMTKLINTINDIYNLHLNPNG